MDRTGWLFGEAPTKKARKHASGPHQELIDHWSSLWRVTRGTDWTWQGRDLRAVRQMLLLGHGDPEPAIRRMERLLRNPPSFWYAQEASPFLVWSRWNNLEVEVRRVPQAERNREALRRSALEL